MTDEDSESSVSQFKLTRKLRRRSETREKLEKAKEQIKRGYLLLKNGDSIHDDPILSQLIKVPANSSKEKRRSVTWEEKLIKDAGHTPAPSDSEDDSSSLFSRKQSALALTRMLHQIQADMAVKGQLVSQLERAEQEYTYMRTKYEQKLVNMQEALINLQRERDAAVKRVQNASSTSSREKKQIIEGLKVEYESKVKKLTQEIGELRRKNNRNPRINMNSNLLKKKDEEIKLMDLKIQGLEKKIELMVQDETQTIVSTDIADINLETLPDVKKRLARKRKQLTTALHGGGDTKQLHKEVKKIEKELIYLEELEKNMENKIELEKDLTTLQQEKGSLEVELKQVENNFKQLESELSKKQIILEYLEYRNEYLTLTLKKDKDELNPKIKEIEEELVKTKQIKVDLEKNINDQTKKIEELEKRVLESNYLRGQLSKLEELIIDVQIQPLSNIHSSFASNPEPLTTLPIPNGQTQDWINKYLSAEPW